VQQAWSQLPTPSTLLVEQLRSREGHHLFLYPFAGRNVHLGLAALLAWRVSRQTPATFSVAVNDYGLELLAPEPVDWSGLAQGALLSDEGLLEDVQASLNAGELALRRFREIARISGLVFQGFPGATVRASSRHLLACSMKCSVSTMPTVCCCRRRARKCWNRSWKSVVCVWHWSVCGA
jgi:ATP-dependent Lhr-like helicase